MELTAGEYAIFDSRVAHRSGRNLSPNRRIGMKMVYTTAAVHLEAQLLHALTFG